MEKRRLGGRGPVVSALGLGCMGMSEFYGPPDETERFQGENFQKNLVLADRIRAMATGKGATPAQLALAWLMAQGQDIVPIPGTKRRTYLEENIAAQAIRLTAEDLRRIDEIAPKGITAGDRYADMSSVSR